jgi:erythritol transport system permease protein
VIIDQMQSRMQQKAAVVAQKALIQEGEAKG